MKKGKHSNLFSELSIAKLTNDHTNKKEMGTGTYSSVAWEARVCVVRDYISKHKEAWWFIENMHNIYFIFGHASVEGFCDKDDLKWDDILPEPLLSMKRKRTCFPLGFIMVAPNPVMKGVYGIDHLEVFVKGYDIGRKMISRLSRELEAELLVPLDITVCDSFGYWKKYLRDYYENEDHFWETMKEYKVPTDLLVGYTDEPIWDSDDESEMEASPKKIKN